MAGRVSRDWAREEMKTSGGLIRLCLMCIIWLSFTVNMTAYALDRFGFYSFWLKLSPSHHIIDVNAFAFRLGVVHLIGLVFLWFLAGKTGWRRIRQALAVVDREPIYAGALTVCVLIFPVHWFEGHGAQWAHEMIAEDGPLESLTTWFSLAAAALFLYAATQKPEGATLRGCLLAALVFFLFGMEEISWGQRLFGLPTPGFLAHYNYQDETNLHNVFNPGLRPIILTFFLSLAALLFYGAQIDAYLRRHLKISFGLDEADALFSFVFLGVLPWTLGYAEELGEEYFSLFGLAFILRRLAALDRAKRRLAQDAVRRKAVDAQTDEASDRQTDSSQKIRA